MVFLRRHIPLLAALLCILVWAMLPARTLSAMDGEQMRALFVSRIVKYMSWPGQTPAKDRTIIIAAADAHRLRAQLKGTERIKVVQWPADFCHALYFNAGTPREINAVLETLKGRPVLTIGQGDAFMEQGGMVNLKQVGNQLRLEINPGATARAGLGVSSRLMSISIRRGENRPEPPHGAQPPHGNDGPGRPGPNNLGGPPPPDMPHAPPPSHPPSSPPPPPGEVDAPRPAPPKAESPAGRHPDARHRPMRFTARNASQIAGGRPGPRGHEQHHGNGPDPGSGHGPGPGRGPGSGRGPGGGPGGGPGHGPGGGPTAGSPPEPPGDRP